jgi:peptidoglycan/LPS O-acetylase OafA/YrhL
MKTATWAIALAGVGAVLSLKDANWLGDPTPSKLGVLTISAFWGAVLGACLAQIVKPVENKKKRVYKVILWVCAFAILGLALGHGNVPWSRTLEIIGYSSVVGLVVGLLHYAVARPQSSTAP